MRYIHEVYTSRILIFTWMYSLANLVSSYLFLLTALKDNYIDRHVGILYDYVHFRF